jgi:hypothetical protein
MESDENCTFREPVANFCLLATEAQRFTTGLITDNAVKLFRFLKCEDPSQRDRLSRKLSEQHRQLHARSIDARGWPIGSCVNTTLAPQSEGLIAWGLAADCSEEFWFKDLDDLQSFRQHCDVNPTLSNLADCKIVSRIEVITNEVVLHDVPGQTLSGDCQ